LLLLPNRINYLKERKTNSVFFFGNKSAKTLQASDYAPKSKPTTVLMYEF